MQNVDNKYRKFRYYEGVCSAGDFVKEIAKVFSMGVKQKNTTITLKDDDNNAYETPQTFFGKNWDIVYPQPSETFINKLKEENGGKDWDFSREKYKDTYNNLTPENKTYKLLDQIDQITNNVVLKTTTTEKVISSDTIDDLSVSGETDQASKTMYVQIYKPKYIANPEEYPLDAELHGLIPQVVTKEMYTEARQTTIAKQFDLANLIQKGYFGTKVTKPSKVESISSKWYEESVLFNGDNAKFKGLCTVLGKSSLFNPDTDNSVFGEKVSEIMEIDLISTYLNAIKQTQQTLYNFLMEICNAITAFSETDYDALTKMHIKIVRRKQDASADGSTENLYEVMLSYVKTVNIYEIPAGIIINISNSEFGKLEATEKITPELYSEGRYIKIDSNYYSDQTNKSFRFTKDISFCLDSIVQDEVDEGSDKINTLKGTLVLRFKTEKKDGYQGLEALKNSISTSVSLENNHYCIIRMFDNPNTNFSGPEPNLLDSNGQIINTNSHTSPWSKLSWYQDFEEISVDEIDEDVSLTSIVDGTLFVPLQTPGLTSDTRISYWVNTNNDRTVLVVMGNPALDYERDRHLISSCYIGQIESFENSINDVSGNFALYTSSSTTPCNTIMQSNLTHHHLNYDDYDDLLNMSELMKNGAVLTKSDIQQYDGINNNGGIDLKTPFNNFLALYEDNGEFAQHKQSKSNISDGEGFYVYYLTLTENQYFNESEIPRIMAINKFNGQIKIPYSLADGRELIRSTSDSRANKMAIYVNNVTAQSLDSGDEIYFFFGYYEEKFTITSGITRDMFGNVVDIDNIKDFGINTSDGTTSISMYHTRTKAFYQKHQFLFATTEEYMSKSQYGKSSYTGEYYADRIKVTHGNDGPRGILSDILVIDSSSLYPKDELVINKDFEKNPDELEETFTYFPITAPFSPLSDGPNARYGIAIKKAEQEPIYKDGDKILAISENELNAIMNDNKMISDDLSLLGKTETDAIIYWDIEPASEWIVDNSGLRITKEIGNLNQQTISKTFIGKEFAANKNAAIVKINGFTREDPDAVTNPQKLEATIAAVSGSKTQDFVSHVALTLGSGSTISSANDIKIYYGYSEQAIETVHGEPVIAKIFDTGIPGDIREYVYADCFLDGTYIRIDPYHPVDKTHLTDISLYNADPKEYLNILITQKSENDMVLKQFISVPLTDDNDDHLFDLLQCTCNAKVIIEGISADAINTTGIIENGNQYVQSKDFYYLPYKTEFSIPCSNISSADFDATITYENDAATNKTATINNNNITIASSDMFDDLTIYIRPKN